MTGKLIDGKGIADRLRQDCFDRIQRLRSKHGITPALAILLIGDDPASAIYVKNKLKAAELSGLSARLHQFPVDADPADILSLIATLNDYPEVHGILVQLPLPPQFDIYEVLHAISSGKDVDGFHLYNVGGLVVGRTVFSPCTPYGVMKLLEAEDIPVEGRNIVVVGASNIVGKPMALMLMKHEATVTVCHAKTRDLGQHTIMADVLIVAAGVPNLIVPQMVKRGAVVIDVGINRMPDGRIVGDTDFTGLLPKVSHITPVPGGVGPMTITMLIANTVQAAERQAASGSGRTFFAEPSIDSFGNDV